MTLLTLQVNSFELDESGSESLSFPTLITPQFVNVPRGEREREIMLYLSELQQVQLERLNIIFKP